jgi:hypothetical protein
MFGTVMRDIYGLYARVALGVAGGYFLLSFVLMMFGLQFYVPPQG